MRTSRIYHPGPLRTGAIIALEPAAFQHVARVLRLKPGASLVLFDGSGGEYQALLETVARREALVRIERFVSREVESPLEVLLAQGVSKGERMDYTLQKAVELGVGAIQPVLTERSVASVEGRRSVKRLQHWRKVVSSACEQCGRNRLPVVYEPLALRDWLQRHGSAGLRLVLHPEADRGLAEISRTGGSVTLLVGPEGGWSPAEIAHVETLGFTGIRLGPRILRTETAAAAVLTAVQLLWGDLA